MANSKSSKQKKDEKKDTTPVVKAEAKAPETAKPEIDIITLNLEEFMATVTVPAEKLLLASMRLTHGTVKMNKASWTDALHTCANREVK